MRLQDVLGRLLSRGPVVRRRARHPEIERLEGRAVPASYTAASVDKLREFISAANATPEADIITLASGTTFTLTAVDNTTDGPTGLPVVAAGEDLTIVGDRDVIERSTAVGTPAFRLLDVALGGSLRLTNLTLQGGLALAMDQFATPRAWSQGGAIYNRGTLELNGVIVQNNTAQGAPGAPTWGGGPGGPAAGGGLYSEGALSLDGTTVQKNVVLGGNGHDGSFSVGSEEPIGTPGGAGGGGYGGGLSVGGGTATISDSSFTANIAQGGGGGQGASRYWGSVRISTAGGDGGDGFGAGLYAAGGTLTLRNTEVTQNSAKGGAGGKGGTRSSPDGAPGQGEGGGIYIDTLASVGLDAFTQNHIKSNKASTKDSDINGPYTLIP